MADRSDSLCSLWKHFVMRAEMESALGDSQQAEIYRRASERSTSGLQTVLERGYGLLADTPRKNTLASTRIFSASGWMSFLARNHRPLARSARRL